LRSMLRIDPPLSELILFCFFRPFDLSLIFYRSFTAQ
jgi:hypothetical protein